MPWKLCWFQVIPWPEFLKGLYLHCSGHLRKRTFSFLLTFHDFFFLKSFLLVIFNCVSQFKMKTKVKRSVSWHTDTFPNSPHLAHLLHALADLVQQSSRLQTKILRKRYVTSAASSLHHQLSVLLRRPAPSTRLVHMCLAPSSPCQAKDFGWILDYTLVPIPAPFHL